MPALNFLGRYTRTPALNRFLCVWIHCEIFGLLAHKKSGNILYYKNGLDLNLNTKRIGSFIGIWTWDSKIAKWKWQDSNPCKKVAFWYFSRVNDSVTFVTNKYERTQKKIHSQCDLNPHLLCCVTFQKREKLKYVGQSKTGFLKSLVLDTGHVLCTSYSTQQC